MLTLMTILLTTFISVNGQLMEVAANSTEASAYTQTTTDIGDPENLSLTEEDTESTDSTESGEDESALSTVSDGDAQTIIVEQDNSEVVSLLSDAVELLSEDSASVTGTINSSILDMMDRIIDKYPYYYKYAGFKVDADDSYRTVLYIAPTASVDGKTITFDDKCIAVNFYRYYESGYSSYVYYITSDAPNASVEVGDTAIVYTNCLDGYPSLGSTAKQTYDWVYIILIIALLVIIIVRR